MIGGGAIAIFREPRGDVEIKNLTKQVASDRPVSRSTVEGLRSIARSTPNPVARLWVTAALACLDKCPVEDLSVLLTVMKEADEASEVGAFIDAHARGSPWSNAMEAIVHFADQLLPTLKALDPAFPRQVRECIDEIQEPRQ
jgi:hypothetical protein